MNNIIFVCMGNICRSPLAEAEARQAFAAAGLDEVLSVRSAGTIGHHQGAPADVRSVAVAADAGLDLGAHRARMITPADFEPGNLLVAMDRRNIADLRTRAPVHAQGRIRLLLEFAGRAHGEVADPYLGNRQDFVDCHALIREGVAGLTKHLQRLHNAGQLSME